MTIRQQHNAFNDSLSVVEQANRDLIIIYENALERIETRIARLRLQFEKGLLSQAQINRLNRLEAFSQGILEDITALKTSEYNIITSGWVDAYQNGYYGTGYSIEYDLNTQLLKNTPFDYSVQYRRLNTAYIRQIYSEDIATQVFGYSIKQRTELEILQLQSKIKQTVTQALIEGIPTKEVAKRLQDVDVVFEQNLNHALTVTRTEVLRGHSYGDQQAVDRALDSGITGDDIWDATLDGKTRPTNKYQRLKGLNHRIMDGKKADQETRLFTLPDGSQGRFPRDSTLSVGQTANCRCIRNFIVTGLEPNSRGARAAGGSWYQVNGQMTYQEWSQTLQGRESIEQTQRDNRARAARLAKKRK